MTLPLALLVGLLVTLGVYLLLQRTAARLILGLILTGNGTILGVFVAGGLTRDNPPLIAPGAQAVAEGAADPLPQALVLTAIVIGFAVTALAAVLVWRSQADQQEDGLQENDLDALNRTDT